MFRPSVDWGFLPTCHALETWFELYRNDLKGNKNYFELAGGLSYRRFALPRVKLQEMYEGNLGEINFGSS